MATGRAFRGDPSAFEEARRMPLLAVRWGTSPALEITWVLATQPRSTGRDCGDGPVRIGGARLRYPFIIWIIHQFLPAVGASYPVAYTPPVKIPLIYLSPYPEAFQKPSGNLRETFGKPQVIML